MSRTSHLSALVIAAAISCGRSDSGHKLAKLSDAKTATRTTETELVKAREQYLLIDAALAKLKQEIDETTDAEALAVLRDKELALNLAIKEIRQRIEILESAERQEQPPTPR
jgi:hypothetical protein